MTFDIIRRILEDVFHFDVQCAMNVTDIDDKIIIRARRLHLLREYEAGAPPLSAVVEKSEAAIEFCIRKTRIGLAEIERNKGAAKGSQKAEYESVVKGEEMKLAAMLKALEQLVGDRLKGAMKLEDFFEESNENCNFWNFYFFQFFNSNF